MTRFDVIRNNPWNCGDCLARPFSREDLSIATGYFAHGVTSDEILIELLLVVKLSKVRQISSPSETEAPYKPVLVTVAKVNFGVSADESLVKDFDAAIGQIPRSRAIADLMVDFLERHGFRSPEPKEATS